MYPSITRESAQLRTSWPTLPTPGGPHKIELPGVVTEPAFRSMQSTGRRISSDLCLGTALELEQQLTDRILLDQLPQHRVLPEYVRLSDDLVHRLWSDSLCERLSSFERRGGSELFGRPRCPLGRRSPLSESRSSSSSSSGGLSGCVEDGSCSLQTRLVRRGAPVGRLG